MALGPLSVALCQMLGWRVLLAQRSVTKNSELLVLRQNVTVLGDAISKRLYATNRGERPRSLVVR